MGATVWTYIVMSDARVVRYPRAQFERFFTRRSPAPHAQRDVLRFVDILLETRCGHPLRLLYVTYARHRLDPHGFACPEHQYEAMSDAVEGLTAGFRFGAHDHTVITLEPHLARRRAKLEHQFQPTGRELIALVAAINYDAAKLLVTTDGRTLIPAE
ncbi:MAG TPA: hypothetical protein VMN60_10675 [Longimicrobiales bacterium]|nr:hypothetical protein [Longimicrobiales bacterium]